MSKSANRVKSVKLLADFLTDNQKKFAIAESCTGGLVSVLCTDLPGSSVWFERGFITYSNQSKVEMLGVSDVLIAQFGAVSSEVVLAMANGVLENSTADYAVAISGIAGPSGGSVEKPVGTVFFGFADRNRCLSQRQQFAGDRQSVRFQSAIFSVEFLMDWILTSE